MSSWGDIASETTLEAISRQSLVPLNTQKSPHFFLWPLKYRK